MSAGKLATSGTGLVETLVALVVNIESEGNSTVKMVYHWNTQELEQLIIFFSILRYNVGKDFTLKKYVVLKWVYIYLCFTVHMI